MKRTGLRRRSVKTTAEYVTRRALVASLLTERPWCERCAKARSQDVHELKRRSQGGDILHLPGMVCLCRPCHDWIGAHPALAHAEGWVKWSFE